MNAADLVEQLVAEGLTRSAAERAAATSWSNGPGDRYGAHAHAYDKVLVATSGSITFFLPDRGTSQLLEPGLRLLLPAGTSHAALVGAAGVACLELHLPAGALATLAQTGRQQRA